MGSFLCCMGGLNDTIYLERNWEAFKSKRFGQGGQENIAVTFECKGTSPNAPPFTVADLASEACLLSDSSLQELAEELKLIKNQREK